MKTVPHLDVQELKKARLAKEEPRTLEYSATEKQECDKKTSVIVEKQEDEIFYEDSIEAQDFLRPQYNNALFTEDLKNFIQEHELDV
jgi:hypothetical protein